jgi:hypothetical protein
VNSITHALAGTVVAKAPKDPQWLSITYSRGNE